MSLRNILKKQAPLPSDYSHQLTITSANSTSISHLLVSLPLRTLFQIRSLHLELTLDHAKQRQEDDYFLDHIESNIAQITGKSFTAIRYDRNIETGFSSYKKMKGLFSTLKWLVNKEISYEEFEILYQNWLDTYQITDLISSQACLDINEIFTFFLIMEEPSEFLEDLNTKLELMLSFLSQNYDRRLLTGNIGHTSEGEVIENVSKEWILQAEHIFRVLDEDKKGYMDGEAVQMLVLSMVLEQNSYANPVTLRKQCFSMLQDMKHTNGMVSLRAWKNYLLFRGLFHPDHVAALSSKLNSVLDAWEKAKSVLLEVPELSECTDLQSESFKVPHIWKQAITMSVLGNEKLFQYLMFNGWMIGASPSINTQGQLFIEGTYFKNIPEFSLYLYSSFLEMEGHYHTSVAINHTDLNSMGRLTHEPRYQSILKTLKTYDCIMNACIMHLIYHFRLAPAKKEPPTPPAHPPRQASRSPVPKPQVIRNSKSAVRLKAVQNVSQFHTNSKTPTRRITQSTVNLRTKK